MVAGRRKLILVSNRGPVTYGRDESGERTARRGAGGLVTALRGLLSHHDVTWIASAMSEEDRRRGRRSPATSRSTERTDDGSEFWLRLVAHDEAAYDRYYNVVSNPMLWFLQHYLWDLAYKPALDVADQHAWDDGYAQVNSGFAEAVLAELEREPEAAVFFHDYHLYLAPRLVRERAPDALLAHFIHIPWPQTDYWRVLPEATRRAIHDGLARERCDRLPHAPLAAELHARRERPGRGRVRLRGRARHEYQRPPLADQRASHLRRPARVPAARGERRGARGRARSRRPAGPSS